MRVHFELKYGAETLDQARVEAYKRVASFMDVTEAEVPALIDLEVKVAVPDPEKDLGFTANFAVTAYVNVKNSIAKPF
jgi:hypothetical protein